MEVKVVADNIVIEYENVTKYQFDEILKLLDYHERNGLIGEIYQKIGKGLSEYHYTILIGGKGGGRITFQWKHNSRKEQSLNHSARLEVNPQKITREHEHGLHCIQNVIGANPIKLKYLDIAFDIPVMKDNIIIQSKNGRDENRFHGTRYLGSKGKHGHTKIYDKKKELKDIQGIEVSDENLTRLEFTYKSDDGVYLDRLQRLKIRPSELYEVYVIGNDELSVKAEIRACIMAYIMGWTQLKDYTRTTQVKIKEALPCPLALDKLIEGAWQDITNTIIRIGYDFYYDMVKAI